MTLHRNRFTTVSFDVVSTDVVRAVRMVRAIITSMLRVQVHNVRLFRDFWGVAVVGQRIVG
jgi:hypothetical protein